LQRLLDASPRLSVLSQPFPLVFVEAKRAFLDERGIVASSPLGHLFGERRYYPDDFAAFLEAWRPDPPALIRLFTSMETYSGQYTRFGRAAVARAVAAVGSEGDFAATIGGLFRELGGRPGAMVYGGKETTCEEVLPHLLSRGLRGVLIVRDPRDVIASLNHGRGRDHGGAVKPTLFNIRQWRKSVAFALSLSGKPGFDWLRYEDLVEEPKAALGQVANSLSLPYLQGAVGELRDRDGSAWRGNSSHTEHQGVSAASVGSYRGILPAGLASFIEATCLPEMRLLGYETAVRRDEAPAIIRRFVDPYELQRPDLVGDAATAENLETEVLRLELLERCKPSDIRPYFVTEAAHASLVKVSTE
jgi:hypothetical protein